MDPSAPSLISFCTGYGGLELGIERAVGRPCRVLAYAEIEAFAIENLIDEMDYVRITFCCASCDRSFVEIYEYDHTEDEDGNDVDFWRALPRKPRR